jgi:hypothetical protein
MYNGFSALCTDGDDEDDGAAGVEAELTAPPELASAPVALPPLADGEHPFSCDPGDHAETPLVAFQDIAPLLRRLASKSGLTPATLQLYDPFFCTGACVTHLRSLGFDNVYNRNEDFYRVRASSAVPAHNVLVSNPPYTGGHLESTFRFCWANQGRPFFLLVPQFVAKKPWLLEHLDREANRGRGASSRLLYLGPKTQPYVFSAPAVRADVVKKRGGVTAAVQATSFPVSAGKFQAVWVIGGLGTQREPLAEWWRRCSADADCVLASSPAELPQFAAAQTPAERRWKRKARDTDNEDGVGVEQQPPSADADRAEKRARSPPLSTLLARHLAG